MTEQITRRRIIKGAGTGAALVWSAPTVLSLGASAGAGSPNPGACGPHCDSPLDFNCPEDSSCLCAARQDGNGSFCWFNGTCFDCSTDADCVAAGFGANSSCGALANCPDPCGAVRTFCVVTGCGPNPNGAAARAGAPGLS